MPDKKLLTASTYSLILDATLRGFHYKLEPQDIQCRHKGCGYKGKSVAPNRWVDDSLVQCQMEIFPLMTAEIVADPEVDRIFAYLKLEIFIGGDIAGWDPNQVMSRHYMLDMKSDDFISGPWKPYYKGGRPKNKEKAGVRRTAQGLKQLDPKLCRNYEELRKAVGTEL